MKCITITTQSRYYYIQKNVIFSSSYLQIKANVNYTYYIFSTTPTFLSVFQLDARNRFFAA